MNNVWKKSVATAKFGTSCLSFVTCLGVFLYNIGFTDLEWLTGAKDLSGKRK